MKAGTLYVVATPIGNLGDMTPRALEVLRSVGHIAAEDTRHSAGLLRHFGIATPLFALHEHNEREASAEVVRRLQQGEDIALISDAGTPLISDPGFPLTRLAHEQGVRVVPVPGASALVAALSAAGLPTDRFVFEGFLPAKRGTRRNALEALRREHRTLAFYEAPHRLLECLEDLAEIFGPDRLAVLARELTKTFETVRRASLGELAAFVRDDPDQQRGEAVLLVQGAPALEGEGLEEETRRVAELLAGELPVKQAAALAAKLTGAKKNRIYDYLVKR